jgi:membrane-associated phospholipid phosphatase
MFRSLTRRRFFAGALSALPLPKLAAAASEAPDSPRPANPRLQAAFEIRRQTAAAQSDRAIASMKSNRDEDSLPARIGCYTKALPQNRYGEVEPKAYNALLEAIKSGKFEDFERIPRAGGRKLNNPQCGFAFATEGGDPQSFDLPPAPSIASRDAAADIAELYWQSLCRDVPFADFTRSDVVQRAARSLGQDRTAAFRGFTHNDSAGPYVSQFLLKPIPFGAFRIEQRLTVPPPGSDFMTEFAEWAQIQQGFPPWRVLEYDPTPRYIRNGRDLAEYVHYDFAPQAYLTAALILINSSAKTILNCNQFKSGNNPYRYSTVEEGFATFGPAEAVDWIGRVVTPALKAAYCQKWMVHRRARPEEVGGLIHQTRTGSRNYPIHESILKSEAVDAVYAKTGSYLLPQAYPEGCPTHPSYPAGHAAIAGAGAVILKACFDGSMLFPGLVEPAADGLTLKECKGYSPTVDDEINKLASNIAMARNWAGIHFRSDDSAGLLLGEEVGIAVLQDLARTYSETYTGFSFRRFDGSRVHITPKGELVAG